MRPCMCWRTMRTCLIGCSLVAGFLAGIETRSHAQTRQPSPTAEPAPAPTAAPVPLETATFGAGCFWCSEAVFQRLKGIHSVVSGYSGGHVKNPTYQQVSSGWTGHAEVIQLTFDPSQISYAQLLEVFWKTHDPTTLNRQGPDFGTQYRSVIFYHSPQQKQVAEETIAELNQAGIWKNPIVTQVVPVGSFFVAEDYHQSYFKKNPYQGYCQVVIAPKLSKFRKSYQSRLKTNL